VNLRGKVEGQKHRKAHDQNAHLNSRVHAGMDGLVIVAHRDDPDGIAIKNDPFPDDQVAVNHGVPRFCRKSGKNAGDVDIAFPIRCKRLPVVLIHRSGKDVRMGLKGP